MNTNYTPMKQAKPKGYRLHRVPRRDHRDYETALAHAQGIYGKVRRAGGACGRYWLMYVPLSRKDSEG